MRKLLYTALALIALSCSDGLSPEEQAARAALDYYNCLLEGRPEKLLPARAGADSLPADYRRQLELAYRQYAADMRQKHGGLRSVSVSENPPRRDTLQGLVHAFLILTFNDSAQEEISVAMVQKNGAWRLR